MSQTALMDSPQRGVTGTPVDSDDETWQEASPWQQQPDRRCSGRLAYLLICAFSVTSCITSSALWIHLPVASKLLPEKDSLTLRLLMVQEVASVAPLIYFIVRRYCPGKPHDVPFLYAIFTVGISCCLLLGLFWRERNMVNGTWHSVTYLCLALLISSSCLCFPLVFFSFLSNLGPRYITAYFIGEGLGCLLPHLVAIAQGINNLSDCKKDSSSKDNRLNSLYFQHHLQMKVPESPSTGDRGNKSTASFGTDLPSAGSQILASADAYFYYISGLMALCAVAFTLLRYLPYFKSQFINETPVVHSFVSFSDTRTGVKTPGAQQPHDTWPHRYHDYTKEEVNHYGRQNKSTTESSAVATGIDQPSSHTKEPVLNDQKATRPNHHSINSINWRDSPPAAPQHVDTMPQPRSSSQRHQRVSRSSSGGKEKPKHTLLLLVITGWTTMLLQGPLSSAKAYADLPVSNNYFIMGSLLTNSVAPFCCALAYKFPPRSRVTVIVALTALGTILLTYFLALMGFSQAAGEGSPMAGNAGELLAVIAWLAISGLFSYTKVSIATIFRAEGTRQLLWFACCMALGTALGTLALINNLNISLVFKKYINCPQS